MIVVEGTVRVADLEKARAGMEAMVTASRAEAGCIEYAYSIDILDPGLVRIIEWWESREALARHVETEHLKVWRASWPELGVSERSLRLYEATPETF